MEQSYEIPLSEYWRILKKRKVTIIAVFSVVVVATMVFTKMQTPVYQASIDLKVDRAVSMDKGASGSSEAMLKSLDLGTELRLLKSLNVLSKVVEKVEVLPLDPKERVLALNSLALGYQGRISVEQIPDTTIITIKATAETPEKASLLVSAVADVYISENTHGKKRQLDSVLKYVDTQIEDYKTQLSGIENRLLKFKQDEKVFSVTPDVKANLDRLGVERTFDLENDMLRIDSNIKELSMILDTRRQSGQFKGISSEYLAENFIFTSLKRRLLQLEFERFLLLVDYTEKHPAVIEKDRIIADTKARMVDMIKSHWQGPYSADMEADLSMVVKKLFLESRREVLYRTINRYYSDEGSLSVNQRDYISMTREQERLVKAYNTLLENREETRLSMARVEGQTVTVVSQASAGRDPISPKTRINFMVSLVAGFVLGMMACFLQESMDTTINTIADVEHKLNLSVLGIIPMMKSDENADVSGDPVEKVIPRIDTLVTFYEPRSWLSQSFKILRANLLQALKANDRKVVLFTSSEQQEGKSTVIANVAITMAQMGKKTLLVELNLRRPTLYKRLGLRREPGMTEVLLGKVAWPDALKTPTDIIAGGLDLDRLLKMPGLDHLRVLTAGHSIDNISELLNSSKFDEFIAEVRARFDIVLIDCPPILPVPDAMTMGSRVDGVVLIYKVGKTSRDMLRMAKSRLEHANTRILGIVLNQIKAEEQVGASAYHFREYVETKTKGSFAPADWLPKG
jgi:capsular exopolysaccharide synthesis family protein